jgi:hypothetical protein
MFICCNCNGNVVSYGNSSKNWKKYICGVNRSKGPDGCSSKWFVDQYWLEELLVKEIEQRYTAPDKLDKIISDLSNKIRDNNLSVTKDINTVEKNIKLHNHEIKNLLNAIKSGIDASIISDEINKINEEKDNLETQLKNLKNKHTSDNKINPDLLKSFFINFRKSYDLASIQERKKLIRTFIKRLELDPKTKEIRVEFYPDDIVKSIGAGDRN